MLFKALKIMSTTKHNPIPITSHQIRSQTQSMQAAHRLKAKSVDLNK